MEVKMKNLCLIIIIALALTQVIFSQRGEVSRVPHRGEEKSINPNQGGPSDNRLDRAKDNKENKTIPVLPVQEEPSPSEPVDPGYSIPVAVYCQVTIDIIDIPAREVKVYTSKKKEAIESLNHENYYQAVLLFSDAIAENQKDIEYYTTCAVLLNWGTDLMIRQ
jgi:hypothetical protein